MPLRVRPFRYCFDSVCLCALFLYALNRWYIKPSPIGRHGFFHDYFNDCLLIPLFLPPTLWVLRLLRIRPPHAAPTAFEFLYHCFVWSILFEVVLPLFPNIWRTTADPLDAASYLLGGLVAGLIWKSFRSPANEVTIPHAYENRRRIHFALHTSRAG